MSRLFGVVCLCIGLASASCLRITEPTGSSSESSRQKPSSASRTLSQAPVELGRTHEPQVSGAFRHGEFVISVHGLRLEPDYYIQAVYELDGEPPWPEQAYGGQDFHTSYDGSLWEDVGLSSYDTGVVARLKETGNGFTYSVPLATLRNSTGPITFAIIVFELVPGPLPGELIPGEFFYRAFGRAECHQCREVATRP